MGFTDFLKTTFLGGLLVLLPVLLLYLLLVKTLQVVVQLATPIAALFPGGVSEQVHFPVLIAVIMTVIVSFLIGLALRSEAGKRVGRGVEGMVLGRLPVYNLLKNLTKAFAKTDAETFKPALLISPDGSRQLAYVVEDHGDDQMTVLLPWAPTAFSGLIKVVARERIEMLDAKLGDVAKALNNMGLGVRDLLAKGEARGPKPEVEGATLPSEN